MHYQKKEICLESGQYWSPLGQLMHFVYADVLVESREKFCVATSTKEFPKGVDTPDPSCLVAETTDMEKRDLPFIGFGKVSKIAVLLGLGK